MRFKEYLNKPSRLCYNSKISTNNVVHGIVMTESHDRLIVLDFDDKERAILKKDIQSVEVVKLKQNRI